MTAEVTPQHLMLNTDADAQIGTLAQMNPPRRSHHDREVLWAGLLDGTIDFIDTDRAPHMLEEKAKGYPNTPSGMPGVETSLSIVNSDMVPSYSSIDRFDDRILNPAIDLDATN